MRHAALLLLPIALACGRKPDPTIASAPSDATAYVRVRSWEELQSAVPILRALGADSNGFAPFPRDSGLALEQFDDRRPFAVAARREGLAFVLPRNPARPVPSPSGEWSAEPLPGDALGVWTGPKPTFGGMRAGDLLDGLVSLRINLPKIAEASGGEIGKVASAVSAARLFLGLPPEGTPGETVRSWTSALRALETLDLALEGGGRNFEARARLRPSEGSGIGRFAREARGAPHTLAGFLSKEGTILYLETSVDAATVARFFPEGFLGVGPVPFVLPGALGPLAGELASHLDGRGALSIGHEGMDLFVEEIAGLRDGPAYAALLATDRFANAIEDAVAGLAFLQNVVCERNAFRHGDVDVHRLRFELRESGGVPGWRMPERMRDSLERFGVACFAVVGDLLVAVDGADAESRISALLDRVRAGRLDRPPLAASLGSSRGRLAGFALDLGEGARALRGGRVLEAFGGKVSATLEARDGALEVSAKVEVRSPILGGFGGIPR
ncbi:MAG: hypothetical protein L0323_24265 [Planctomycetes bacterium]|nr:hypothetical protein [Planctomycetota bacterium]